MAPAEGRSYLRSSAEPALGISGMEGSGVSAVPHRDPRAVAALRQLALFLAAGATLIAVVALGGWIVGVKEPVRGLAVKANAAIALLLLGAAVLLSGRPHRWSSITAQVLGVLVAIVGGATLAQHLFGWDLGIDQLLFREAPGAPGTASPGRMGPPAAANILLAGIAVVLLEARQRGARWHAQAIALAVSPVPLVGVVGHFYGVEALYAVPVVTGIALPTAVALLLLDVAIMLSRPDRGFIANLATQESGSAVARRMLIHVVLVPIVLGAIVLAGQRMGFYDSAFTVAALVVALCLVLAVLVFRDALVIDRIEAAKKRALAERELSREELARALRREQEARGHAEQASRAKDQFLNTLSHELRTPLNAILGWNRLLREASSDPQRLARGLAVVERNGRALAQLVSDLLDMSRITTGRLQVDRVDVDLGPVVEAAVDDVLPQTEAKGVSLTSRFDPTTPRVVGDPTRLQQIVWNLLSNAVKFTPAGGRIEVRLEAAGGRASLSVRDSGVGISPEFLPHVFDRFTQADGSPARHHGGLGLGLAISRQLVTMHGGTIRAESAGPGHGATFLVDLPASPTATIAPARTDRRGPDVAGARVLVVDDEADSRELLLQLLASWGAKAGGAGSVREALAVLAGERPDLIVSDIAMPGEDGFSLLEHVREGDEDRDAPLPVVALTAFARAEDRRRILSAGFDAHVPKPVEPDELRATIAALLERGGRRGDTAKESGERSGPTPIPLVTPASHPA
jgi:signal transduction histidine kinase/CheY-like chemotaxis protein